MTRIHNVGKSKTVMLKRRKRKRGGIGKRRKKREPSDNKITFDFLNIRGFNSKVRELNRVLDQLFLANTLNCCTGLFTRIQSDQRSSLDYALISSNLKKLGFIGIYRRRGKT